MLVLSRRAGESLRIGGGILVTIVRVSGQEVRLGIAAPRDVNIVRSEVLDRASPAPDAAAPDATVPATTPEDLGDRPAL